MNALNGQRFRTVKWPAVAGALAILALSTPAGGADFQIQEIETGLGVGYAVSLVDMNTDGRLDILVVDTDRVVWYENPAWKRRTVIEGRTKKDNVCVAAHDIDSDGRLDLALGADWRPSDTVSSGTLQWLSPGTSPDDPWSVHPIAEEPTLHRIRWADVDADGKAELLAGPLFGRGTSGPAYAERGVRILAFHVPRRPAEDPWPVEVLNEDLHVSHNLWPTDLDADGRLDLLVASYEGVSRLFRASDGTWQRTLIGSGNQETSPSRGASEVKHGRLAGGDYIATIEPWHGFQVVVYTRPKGAAGDSNATLWTRHVLDDQLQWGHAVWCADVDGDPDEELVIGVRDDKGGEVKSGVRIYDPPAGGEGEWARQLVDPGGVAVEDLAAADLNGDGRNEVVAVGRKTKNVRIYWNGQPGPRLVDVRKIWDRAPHNAFTDLIRFQDQWFCVFREGQDHVSPDGALRVITSKDGERWESAALVTSTTADLRDAKITVTPDGRLMLCGGAALHAPRGHTHESMVWYSPDGTSWDAGAVVARPNDWLWRVTWHKGTAYGIGYDCGDKKDICLYKSSDGKSFDVLREGLFREGYPNETSLVFLPDETCLCLMRRDDAPGTGLLGTARPPYTDWTWKDLGKRIGGPHMLRLPDGRFVAAVRLYEPVVRTGLCWLDPEKGTLDEFLTLPSGGDTSYPGLVIHDGLLWVSYYSSHEGKTSVYLARVKMGR